MSSLFDTGIRPAVDWWLLREAKKTRDYGEYFSASQAGYCMRRVIFERLGVPKVESEQDARKQRVFTAGKLFHDWLQSITKEAGLSIAQELELQDEELMIRGHVDDLVLVGGSVTPEYYIGVDFALPIPHDKPSVTKEELQQAMDADTGEKWDKKALKQILDTAPPKHLILYDYKTQNSRAFNYKRPDMSYYHKMQLGTYMYMLRKFSTFSPPQDHPQYGQLIEPAKDLTEARILKMDKDTLRMTEEQLMWSPQLESEVVSYWKAINEHWKNKTLPKCTCHVHEGGFMAKEAWNGYFMDGEPCSLKIYQAWRVKNKEVANDR